MILWGRSGRNFGNPRDLGTTSTEQTKTTTHGLDLDWISPHPSIEANAAFHLDCEVEIAQRKQIVKASDFTQITTYAVK